MDAGFIVHVRHSADELGEDLLCLGGLDGAFLEEVVVELIAYCVSESPKVFCVCMYMDSAHLDSTRAPARRVSL